MADDGRAAGVGDFAAELFSLEDLRGFHASLLGEMDREVRRHLEGDVTPADEDVEALAAAAFENIRVAALETAADASLPPRGVRKGGCRQTSSAADARGGSGSSSGGGGDASLGLPDTYNAPGADVVADARAQLDALLRDADASGVPAADVRPVVTSFMQKLEKFVGIPRLSAGHLQLEGITAAVRTLITVCKPEAPSADGGSLSLAPGSVDGAVADAELRGRDFSDELDRRVAHVQAAAATHAQLRDVQSGANACVAECHALSREATWFADFHERAAEAIVETSEVHSTGGVLADEQERLAENLVSRRAKLENLCEEANTTLGRVLGLYERFQSLVGAIERTAVECRTAEVKCAAADAAQERVGGFVYKEIDAQRAKSRAAAASGALADLSAAFLRDLTRATDTQLDAALVQSEDRLAWRRRMLYDVSEQYFLALEEHQEAEASAVTRTDSKLDFKRAHAPDTAAVAVLQDEQARSLKNLEYIEAEMLKVRDIVESNGARDAVRDSTARDGGDFLDRYDSRRRRARGREYFDDLLARIREVSERLADVVDTHAVGRTLDEDAVADAAAAMHALLVAAADPDAVVEHAEALGPRELPATLNRLKRATRAAGMTYQEVNQTDPQLLKVATPAYALPAGGRGGCLAQLAAEVFTALDDAVHAAREVQGR